MPEGEPVMNFLVEREESFTRVSNAVSQTEQE